LEQGISQLDFELRVHNTPKLSKMSALLSIETTVFLSEVGRLNGDASPWMPLVYGVICTFPGGWYGFDANKGIAKQVMQRYGPSGRRRQR